MGLEDDDLLATPEPPQDMREVAAFLNRFTQTLENITLTIANGEDAMALLSMLDTFTALRKFIVNVYTGTHSPNNLGEFLLRHSPSLRGCFVSLSTFSDTETQWEWMDWFHDPDFLPHVKDLQIAGTTSAVRPTLPLAPWLTRHGSTLERFLFQDFANIWENMREIFEIIAEQRDPKRPAFVDLNLGLESISPRDIIDIIRLFPALHELNISCQILQNDSGGFGLVRYVYPVNKNSIPI